MGKRSNLAVGGIVIAGVSYLAGILTAPKSGRETRRDIRRKAAQVKREAERTLKKRHDDLAKLLDEAQTQARKVKGKASTELKAVIEAGETVKQKTREILSAIHEGDAEDHDLDKAVKEVTSAVDHLKKYVAKRG